MGEFSTAQYAAALKAVESDDASPSEKAEMLMEIAMGLQQKPKSPRQIEEALKLYEQAQAICPVDASLLSARIRARQGTAYQALPSGGNTPLFEAQKCFEGALASLKSIGLPEEVAEVEMNLGLTLQSLSQSGQARIQDAIQAYLRALRVFDRESYPQEFAILHNNLAIAYLSMPVTDERSKMSEALAVQSFEEVLKVINIVDHPSEYAMIQNNLGNALQYVTSGHELLNNLRAIEAYDEALKVRTRRDTPLEYANTIANKANVLRKMDRIELDGVEHTRTSNLRQAIDLYRQAREIFSQFEQADGVAIVDEMLFETENELRLLACEET